MTSSETHKILITTSIILLVCVCVFSYMVWQIKRSGVELLDTIALIEDAKTTERKVTEAENELVSTEKEREQLQDFIIQDDKDTIELLTLVETVASEQGVHITTNTLKVATTKTALYDDLQLSFRLEGSSRGVRQVIRLLENLPYESRITSLKLTEASDTNPLTVAVINMLMTIKEGNI